MPLIGSTQYVVVLLISHLDELTHQNQHAVSLLTLQKMFNFSTFDSDMVFTLGVDHCSLFIFTPPTSIFPIPRQYRNTSPITLANPPLPPNNNPIQHLTTHQKPRNPSPT